MPIAMPVFRRKLSRGPLPTEEPAPAERPAPAVAPPTTPPPSTPPRHSFDAVAPAPAPLPIPSKSKPSHSAALISSIKLSSPALPRPSIATATRASPPISSNATTTASTCKTRTTASSSAAPAASSPTVLRPPRLPRADILAAHEARLLEALSRPRASPSVRGPSRPGVPILIELAVTSFVADLATPVSATGFTDIKGWLLQLVQPGQLSRWREAVWTLSGHLRYGSDGVAYSLGGGRGADVRLVADTTVISLFCKEVTRAILAEVPGMDRNKISANAGRQARADQAPLNFFKIAHFFVALQLWEEVGTAEMKTAVDCAIETLRTSTGAGVDQSGEDIISALNGLYYSEGMEGFSQWQLQDASMDAAQLAFLGSGGGLLSSGSGLIASGGW